MKKLSTLIFFAFIAIAAVHAQINPLACAKNIKYPFSIYKIIHDPAKQGHSVSVLVKGNVQSIAGAVATLGGLYKYAAGDIACVKIPVNKIDALAAQPFVDRIEGSSGQVKVLNDTSIFNNNVYLAQHGIDLPQSYTGQGVCVGIIDEGIDFNHKDLRDMNGNTRIKFLWDQYQIQQPDTNYTPHPYDYGQAYTAAQIDNLEAGGVYDQDYSHGTNVTGIAAGNGLALNNYKGVAPNADIIFVAVNTAASDFLTNMVDAFQYIFSMADSLHEPCSINTSLGTYFGSHDAKDLEAQAISYLIAEKNGRFVSCAAGNEGSAPIHLQTNVTPDSSFTWFGGYNSTQQLYFEVWANSADIANVRYMIGADEADSAFGFRGGTNFKPFISQFGYDSMTVYAGTNPLGLVETYLDSANGTYSLMCQITPDSGGYYWRFMTTGNGEFDAWSYDLVPGGLPSPINFPEITKYILPDVNQTICSSFTCSPNVMTVGAYANRNYFSDVNLDIVYDTMLSPFTHITVGSLANFSSHGPTRDGRIKPDITATGQWVLSCAAANDIAGLLEYDPTYLAAGGEHRLATGTSMAGPVVAGAGALYLQKNPTASYQEIKDAIITCARTDQFTNASPLPNNSWGYGKLDAYNAIKGCATGLVEPNIAGNVFLENYPNPFSDQTTIHYDLSFLKENVAGALITISDALGRHLRDIALTAQEGNVVINRNALGSGIYFYSLLLNGKVVRTNKLVVL